MKDNLVISSDSLTVNEPKVFQIAKKFIFLIMSIVLCFSSAVIFNKPSSFRFFFIVPLLSLIILYKLFYLKFCKYNLRKLLISYSQVECRLRGHTYIIPVGAIAEIEDRSFYNVQQGNMLEYWHHEFAIKLKRDCRISRISLEEEISLAGGDVSEVVVDNLSLNHDDYKKVIECLR